MQLDALLAILVDCFRLSDRDIHRNRVLVAEQGLLASQRESPREEQARQAVRERIRDLEFCLGHVPGPRDGTGSHS